VYAFEEDEDESDGGWPERTRYASGQLFAITVKTFV
jgi:hypothetical protein